MSKYNVPVPRYTSYPTVPYWQDGLDITRWQENFRAQFAACDGKISLYLHLPFCDSLCTYCGCNKKITTNHSVETTYIKTILKEWSIYLQHMKVKPTIKELHLGGGTPTFFSATNLALLIGGILNECIIPAEHEFSFEGHPNNTTREHLQTLYDLGFRRVSYGVQDNDPEVQIVINRIQPFENVRRATETARSIGYQSVNFDLIYGLPLQTAEKMRKTIEQSISLLPDRVAFYSYAHVPWTSKAQRLFDEHDLPDAETKMNLYYLGKKLFMDSGYADIGMDHFSLPHDSLCQSMKDGRLFRNFMGYTTQQTKMLLGLGVSAISDTGTAFAQNAKTLHDYYAAINNENMAAKKGYFLTPQDSSFRQYILDTICTGKTSFKKEDIETLQQYTFPVLELLADDELVSFDDQQLQVTPKGRHFLRNICSAFDIHLQTSTGNKIAKFSKAI